MARLFVSLLAASMLCSGGAWAQTTPLSHWGGLMYPDLEPTERIGFSIAAFTQFGKDMKDDGTPEERQACLDTRDGDLSVPCGERDPYNDIDETIGINLLSYSRTRPLLRFKSHGSNLTYTHTATVGWINDTITEAYQNRAIHYIAGLQEIPREKAACTNDFDWGKPECYVLGYGGALNYRFYSFDKDRKGTVIRPTPFFIGAGFAISSLLNEAYAQVGVRRFDLTGPLSANVADIVYLSVSAMTRAGAAYSFGFQTFDSVANQFIVSQAGIGLHFLRYRWPIDLELGVVGSSGLFTEQRHPKVNGVETESQQPSRPLPEQFWNLRLVLGNFTFETFNDQLGGKDKGPSYGASLSYTIVPDQNRFTPFAEFRDAGEFFK